MSRRISTYVRLFDPSCSIKPPADEELQADWIPDEPDWYRLAPGALKDQGEILRIAMECAPGIRHSKITENANDLPRPIELFSIAMPGRIATHDERIYWEISRRMSGFDRLDISVDPQINIDMGDLCTWINYPGVPKDPKKMPRPDRKIPELTLKNMCDMIGISLVWLRNPDQGEIPPWLTPWKEWMNRADQEGMFDHLSNDVEITAIAREIPVQAVSNARPKRGRPSQSK